VVTQRVDAGVGDLRLARIPLEAAALGPRFGAARFVFPVRNALLAARLVGAGAFREGVGSFRLRAILGALEYGIGVKYLLDVFAQLDAVELQQADGLLQLWRQRQLLAEPELQGRFGHGRLRA
jgi:hypothetical protein